LSNKTKTEKATTQKKALDSTAQVVRLDVAQVLKMKTAYLDKKKDNKKNKMNKNKKKKKYEEENPFNLFGEGEDDTQQREMIKRAFAGDNVVEEFEREKDQVINSEESDDEKEDTQLAGWGAWTGAGVVPPKKRNKKNAPVVQQPQKKPQKPVRKDAKLKRVIISQKKNKQAEKYLVEDVPYPFNTRQQYELSLLHPLGKDWNTTAVYNAAIRPKIKTKAGVAIPPISKPLKIKKRREKQQKINKINK